MTLNSSTLASTPAADPPKMRGDSIGINLMAGPVYFSNSFAFADAANFRTPWLDNWDQVNPYPLDSRGGLMLPAGKTAQATFFYGPLASSQTPPGRYVVTFDGDADFWGPDGKTYLFAATRGRFEIDLTPNPEGSGAKFTCFRSNPKDRLRNFRVWMPGCESSKSAWRPEFVRSLRGYSILRTIQDQRTNEGLVSTWDDRLPPNAAPYSLRKDGVPIEALCELSGLAGADLWIAVPHKADDTFIRNQAKLALRSLSKSRKIYVEIDNEVWNWGYEVAGWQIGRYAPDGITDPNDNNFYGQTDWYPWFARHVFDIWEEVWGAAGERDRLVTVISSQSAWPDRSRFLLRCAKRFNGGKQPCDVLGEGAYFYASRSIAGDAGDLAPGVTLDDLFADLDRQMGTAVRDEARANRAVADEFGVGLVAYEAGQHLLCQPGPPAEVIARTNALYIAANRDARMERIYLKYLATLHDAGFGEVNLYNQFGGFGVAGSWGLQESPFAALADSPKQRARLGYQFEATGRVIPPGPMPVVVVGPTPKFAARPGPAPKLLRVPGAPATAPAIPAEHVRDMVRARSRALRVAPTHPAAK